MIFLARADPGAAHRRHRPALRPGLDRGAATGNGVRFGLALDDFKQAQSLIHAGPFCASQAPRSCALGLEERPLREINAVHAGHADYSFSSGFDDAVGRACAVAADWPDESTGVFSASCLRRLFRSRDLLSLSNSSSDPSATAGMRGSTWRRRSTKPSGSLSPQPLRLFHLRLSGPLAWCILSPCGPSDHLIGARPPHAMRAG